MYTVADIESIHYPCDLNANQRLSANHRQSIGCVYTTFFFYFLTYTLIHSGRLLCPTEPYKMLFTVLSTTPRVRLYAQSTLHTSPSILSTLCIRASRHVSHTTAKRNAFVIIPILHVYAARLVGPASHPHPVKWPNTQHATRDMRSARRPFGCARNDRKRASLADGTRRENEQGGGGEHERQHAA